MIASALFLVAAAAIDESGVSVKLIPHARSVLQQVLADARLDSARITSTERTYDKQVELMLPQFEAAAAGRRRLVYGEVGTRLYERYLELVEAGRPKAAPLRAELVAKLRALIESYPGPRHELQHLPLGATFAFDVAPSSLRDGRAFRAALRRSRLVVRCIFPGQGGEDAFHLEVARDGSALSGAGHCNSPFEHLTPRRRARRR
jgi:hypothetical protein